MIEMIKKNIAVIAVIAVTVLVLGMVFVLENKENPQPVQVNISAQKPKKTKTPEITDIPEETDAPTASPSVTVKPEKTSNPTEAPIVSAKEKTELYALGEENTVKYTAQSDNKSQRCTIAIYCNTLLNNMNLLDPEKHSLVPSEGCILADFEVEIKAGDSVFDILKRATKANKIHMEFMNTPIYNSAYIEGINNLYEFDAGEVSGWIYCVNKEFPNYGSSRYEVKPGDKIEWHYSCDLGRDVNGKVISQKDD